MQLTGDTVPEFNETFTITLTYPTPPANVEISSANGSALGTITNDDGTGFKLSLVDTSGVAEGDTGDADKSIMFRVDVIPPINEAISVKWTAASVPSEDTATAGDDYTASADNTLNFLANATTQNFSVPILGDNIDENDESFTVTLSEPTGASNNPTIIAPASVQGTINDNDPLPVISASDLTVSSSADAFSIQLNLDPVSGRDVSVAFNVLSGSTAAVGNYEFTTTSPVVIPAGQTSAHYKWIDSKWCNYFWGRRN